MPKRKDIEKITTLRKEIFSNYLLISQKAADFILFSKIVKLIENKVHLTEDGL